MCPVGRNLSQYVHWKTTFRGITVSSLVHGHSIRALALPLPQVAVSSEGTCPLIQLYRSCLPGRQILVAYGCLVTLSRCTLLQKHGNECQRILALTSRCG